MKTEHTEVRGDREEQKSNRWRPLLWLASSRPSPADDAQQLVEARRASVRQVLKTHTDDCTTAPVAAALVSLRADGSVDLLTVDIEPAFIDSMVEGLEILTERLRAHGRSRQRPNWHGESGFGTLLTLIPLVIAAATYINDVAWIDAALTLAGHAFMALLEKKRPHS
jgi:hypothetical protein